MANRTINAAIDPTFSFTGQISFAVTDSHGTNRTVSVGTAGVTTYWRIGLAQSAANGLTEANAKPFGREVAAAMNAGTGASDWQVGLDATLCRVTLTWNGTGTAGVSWTVSTQVRDILGFTGTGFSSLASGGTQTAANSPIGIVFLYCRADDTGYTPEPQNMSICEMPGGEVVAYIDPTRTLVRTFTAAGIPHTPADASGFSESNVTPAYPTDSGTRYSAPSLTIGNVNCVGPWSWFDFISTVAGRRCGATFGDFQNILSGSVSTYEAGYIGADTLRADNVIRKWGPSPYYAKRRDVGPIVFRRAAVESL